MALEGRRAARPAKTDVVIMGGLFHRLRELYSKEGGACRTAAEHRLGLSPAGRTDRRGDRPGVQRQGTGRRLRPTDRRPAGQGRRVAAGLRPAARRRHHLEWLLDLLRLLDPGRQPDGPSRQRRPLRHGPDAWLGLAGQPAHPLQPRLGRSGGQSMGCAEEASGLVGWRQVGRYRRAGLQGRFTSGRWHEPLHHEPRRWRGCSPWTR